MNRMKPPEGPHSSTRKSLVLVSAFSLMLASAAAGPGLTNDSINKPWMKGPWSDPNFFPLAVWLQHPNNAERYRRAGFNTYVGLWQGPTEEQLTALKKTGLRVVCAQNAVGLRHRDDPMIIGWMQDDEPDNAQSLGARLGWSSPVEPAKVIEKYDRLRTADPLRPILLNLGQGVAWDEWYGRGTRSNHPEDYPKYLQGCDIASFDIYPVNHARREVSGNLWFVARGVERLHQWTGGEKLVWNCLECTAIDTPQRKPTPLQVRAQAWMSIIHGSRGLIYFVHQFKPTCREAALLDDAVMLAEVTALNRQMTELAAVLNSPTIQNALTVKTEKPDAPVATLVKRRNGMTYLFAVAMRDAATEATFRFQGADAASIEVLEEKRTIQAKDGTFQDRFKPWEVHLYRFLSATGN